MKDEEAFIVCALADQALTVEGFSFDRSCSRCKRRVMIAPSGMKQLQAEPMIQVLCVECLIELFQKGSFRKNLEIEYVSEEQISEILHRTAPNTYRHRN